MLRVTEVIKSVGLMGDLSFMSDFGMARGSAVHKATELDDLGTLDESSVHEEVAPRLESYRRWRRESGAHIVATEGVVNGDGFIGHYDRLLKLGDRRFVVDLKGGVAAPWHRIQTAAYSSCLGRIARACLYLHDDGRAATFVEHADRRDFDVWIHALSVAIWKNENRV